jgi:hypothetical protein
LTSENVPREAVKTQGAKDRWKQVGTDTEARVCRTVWGGLEETVTHSMQMSHSAYRVAPRLEYDIRPPEAQEVVTAEPEEWVVSVDWIGDFVFYN